MVPAGVGTAELTEKRSRFLATVAPVGSAGEARELLEGIRKEHRDARHHCWCWRLSDGTERYSDDGEPQGSAGLPMLEVFRHEGITDAACVVTRYFGGVLLGTGGLSRAYAGAAKEALLDAGVRVRRELAEISLRVPYGMLERMKKLLEDAGAEITGAEYGADVGLTAKVAAEDAAAVASRIVEESAGRITAALADGGLS
ncbi:MAG: IMPACT family protein [Oscillospiraceae bacterium]|nr:IMPACT family protein [Oscillospiraceae bacterium]